MKTPLGSQTATLQVAVDGQMLTGTFTSKLGSGAISEGRVAGGKIGWNVALRFPVPVNAEFKATIDGNDLTGTAVLGRFGTAPFKGTRT